MTVLETVIQNVQAKIYVQLCKAFENLNKIENYWFRWMRKIWSEAKILLLTIFKINIGVSTLELSKHPQKLVPIMNLFFLVCTANDFVG